MALVFSSLNYGYCSPYAGPSQSTTHILYPTEPQAAIAYRPMAASQLAIASTRFNTVQGSYHLTTSSHSTTTPATGTLQPLSHFSQSGQFQYVATNPPGQNVQHGSATFQPRPVQGIAYGQVLQPGSIHVAATPLQATYIANPSRPLQQPSLGYGMASTSTATYPTTQQATPERMPTYSPQDSFSPQPPAHPQGRPHWNPPSFP